MLLFKLAWHSLLNRKGSVLLTLASITLSVVIVIGVEHIRSQARQGFSRTISSVDLIVGARTSQINLLLYAIFRIGNATNGVSWESYQSLAGDSRVAWSIPLALGDSHQGYRVLGTTADYFEFFKYGSQTALAFREGREFAGNLEAVLGFAVARKLNYKIGDQLVLAHGLGTVSFSKHDDAPFTVVGILAPTGTPVDQTVHISLQGMEAIHLGWQNGVKIPGQEPVHAEDAHAQLQPGSITAFMLGLKSRVAVFGMQRDINDYAAEPLTAILPGVALAELWETLGMMEQVLGLISALVLLASLLGLATLLLASMKERAREIALYRAVGAHSSSIVFLIEVESFLVTCFGILLGFLLVYALLLGGQGWLSEEYGLVIATLPMNPTIAMFMLAILVASLLLALIPAMSAYRSSLAGKLKFGS